MTTRKRLTVPATQFKAKCLELMDEVHDGRREEIVITKRGKPWARLTRTAPPASAPALWGSMKGSIRISPDVDLTAPQEKLWESLRD